MCGGAVSLYFSSSEAANITASERYWYHGAAEVIGPAAQACGRVVRAVQKLEQHRIRIRRGSDGFIWQHPLPQCLMIGGIRGPYLRFGTTGRLRIRIGVERRLLHRTSNRARPPSSTYT